MIVEDWKVLNRYFILVWNSSLVKNHKVRLKLKPEYLGYIVNPFSLDHRTGIHWFIALIWSYFNVLLEI